MKQINCRIIDYINDKLEQVEYYKRPVNIVDVLHFIKEEVLAAHDSIVKMEADHSLTVAEVTMLRERTEELEQEITQLSQRPLANRVAELEQENARLAAENSRLLERQRALAEMGVFEDILRHPRTV